MQFIETSFDTNRHHIHIELRVKNYKGIEYSVDAILDTGAPFTEFSDHFLRFTGFIDSLHDSVSVKSGLQSQKYDKISIPEINICGHLLNDIEIFVSHFEESWGIDALIGLDFFRKFIVEVDYSQGIIRTMQFNK